MTASEPTVAAVGRSDTVVIGSGLAPELAAALGVGWAAQLVPKPSELRRLVVWGPLRSVREACRRHSAAAVVWRVDGLALPFAAADADLVASLGAVVVADEAALPLVAQHNVRSHHIRCLLEAIEPSGSPERTHASGPLVGVAVDATNAGAALLLLKQLLHGGVLHCSQCGTAATAPFDPTIRRFGRAPVCRCDAMPEARPLDATIIVGVAGPDDGGATEMARWLELGDEVKLVAPPELLEARPDLIVDLGNGVDVGWGSALGRAVDSPVLVPSVRDAGATTIGVRTETDADGRVLSVPDPVDTDRQLRRRLGGDPVGDRGRSGLERPQRGHLLERWARVLDSVDPLPSRRVRLAPHARLSRAPR